MTASDSSTDPAGSGSFTTIPESECRVLLSVGFIGRIAFNSPAGIQLVPVNYLYQGKSVYLRVSAESVFGILADGADDVAFQVDHLEQLFKQAWSVLVKGRIAAVTDPAELESLRGQRKLEPWALGDRQLYLRLDPVKVTGRKVKRNAP